MYLPSLIAYDVQGGTVNAFFGKTINDYLENACHFVDHGGGFPNLHRHSDDIPYGNGKN